MTKPTKLAEHATVADPDSIAGIERELERDRCQAILDCPESDLRAGLARHLAFETELTVKECREILRRSPVDQTKAADISAFFRVRSPTFLNEAVR